jgi:hypothetical protein
MPRCNAPLQRLGELADVFLASQDFRTRAVDPKKELRRIIEVELRPGGEPGRRPRNVLGLPSTCLIGAGAEAGAAVAGEDYQ